MFLGELVAPLGVVADAFVRLLQMSVLPYVTLSIITNLGSLEPRDAKKPGIGAAAAIGVLSVTAVAFAFLFPAAFPEIEAASFFSPSLAERGAALDLLDLYVPRNPFHSLANAAVPAVVVFSTLFGLALMGVEDKEPLLNARAWLRFVNTWIDLKKKDGFVDAPYDRWIPGKPSRGRARRAVAVNARRVAPRYTRLPWLRHRAPSTR